MTNSADPDQLASSEPADLDLHCLIRQGMSCSAREGLNEKKKTKEKQLDTLLLWRYGFSFLIFLLESLFISETIQ